MILLIRMAKRRYGVWCNNSSPPVVEVNKGTRGPAIEGESYAAGRLIICDNKFCMSVWVQINLIYKW